MREMHNSIREINQVGAGTSEKICAQQLFSGLPAPAIHLAGISIASRHFHFARPDWAFAQILACFDGQGEVLIADQWRPCGRGQAYITPAHQLHAYRALPGKPWRVCWVIATPDRNTENTWGTAPFLRSADPRPLRDAILNLYREAGSRNDPVLVRAWADMVRLQMLQLVAPHQSDILWPLWEEVLSDLARPWTLAAMADILSISAEHLRRLCVRQLNRSPMEHVTHLRMIRAGAMLVGTAEKIDTIASLTGYTTRFAFSTAFHRYYGTSPAKYRDLGRKT